MLSELYAVVIRRFNARSSILPGKRYFQNGILLSVDRCAGISYGMTQLSINNDRMFYGFELDVVTALINIKSLCIVISKNRSPFNVFRRLLKKPIETNSDEALAEIIIERI